MTASSRSAPPSGTQPLDRDGPWMVLVYEGTVQQAFDPAHQDDGWRAFAEADLHLEAYHVPQDQTPPPVPGSKVDPQAWGWIPIEPAIDGGNAPVR